MKKTLQDQYLLIKEGKGHVGVFLTEAKRQFPNIVRNAATFDEAVASLKTKNIISENVISVMPAMMDRPKKESYETAFEAFLAEAKKKNEDEKVKAEEKKVSKPVEEDLAHNYDNSDDKNPDNMIFDQIMTGYYAEMKDPKNADKTMQQLKDIVFKNLAKDPIYYTKNGQFGVKDLGYVTDHPGLGEPKEPKGKYKSSGYGDLKESKETESEKESEEMLDLQSKLMQLGVNAMVVNAIANSKGIQGLRDRLKEKLKEGEEYYDSDDEEEVKDVRDMSWTKGFTKEEQTLREVIREIIDSELEEAYQLVNINPIKSDKERGERDPSDKYLTFDKDFEKTQIQKGNIIVKDDNRIFITKLLHANLGPKAGNSNLRKYLMDRANLEPTILGGKEVWKIKGAKINSKGNVSVFVPVEKTPKGTNEASLGVVDNDIEVKSFPVDLPISYSDNKNVAHYSDDNEYSGQDDLLDVEDYLEQIEGMSKGDAFDYLKEMGLERDEILAVLRNHKSSSLRESVEKDLADINKEAEHEVLQSKLDKIDALIDHRRSKLGKLDEDEDMKALTDKKKVKELEKDIKKLEVARKKVEKMMSKFKGKKAASKEVIDETENDGLDQQTINDITEKYNEIYSEKGTVDDQDMETITSDYDFSLKPAILDYLSGYDPSSEFDM
jgi:hypothetical protein